MKPNSPVFSLLLLIAGFGPSSADNSISYDPDSVHLLDTRVTGGSIPTHLVRANVAFDNEDITEIPSLSFPRMNLKATSDGGSLATYSKLSSSTRTSADGATKIWHGAMDGDEVGFATLVRNAEGKLAGSISAGDTSYVLNTMPDGAIVIRAVLFEDFPEEQDMDKPPPPVDRSGTSPFQPISDDGSSRRALRSNSLRKRLSQKMDIRDAVRLKDQEKDRSLQTVSVIDVLVIVTNRAMCEAAGLSVGCSATSANRGPIEQLLSVTEADMNLAMQTISIPAEINIVSIHHDTTSFDGDAGVSSLEGLAYAGDGVLDYVQGLQATNQADLVALITGSPGNSDACGVGYRPGQYSVTDYQCIGGYTFIHELGHNFGCHHNPEAGTGPPHAYGNGYLDPGWNGQFRTVMAYDCPNGCPRIPHFSTDEFTFNSSPMGDATHNNARLMGENAEYTASLAGGNGGGGSSLPEPAADEARIRLDFVYDSYPSEVTWSLTHSDGTLIYEVTSVSVIGPVSYNYNLLRGDSYDLVINDSYGDGICCSYGEGGVVIVQEESSGDVTLEVVDGEFASVSSTTFTVNDSSGGGTPGGGTGFVCQDSSTGTFVVDENVGSEDCRWLSTNFYYFGYLCSFVQVALVCPVTCDICELLP